MRKLSALKAMSHAVTSVWTYRAVALRIALLWVPIMLALAVIDVVVGPSDPATAELTTQAVFQLLTGVISFIAACSVAVNWHRFILLDESPSGIRVDGTVLRYAGSTLMIMLVMFTPALLVYAIAALAPPTAALIGMASLILTGGLITRLSVKLPALALGRSDFTFRNAWTASAGNFWPCVAVFMLTLLIAFGCILVLLVLAGLANQMNETAGNAVLTAGAAILQLFYAILNASIYTSLYGYFVEGREF